MSQSQNPPVQKPTLPSRPRVSLIEGDGIGPEITAATLRALEGAGARIDWEPVSAGQRAFETEKDPLPQRTLDSISTNKLALKAGYAYCDATEAFQVSYEVPPARLSPGTYRNLSGNSALA